MTVSGITFLVRDGAAVAPRDRDATAEDDAELLELRAEVCGAAAGGDAAARQLRVRRRQPGFVLAEARHGGYLVAYAVGLPLRPSTSWWKDLTTPLPADLTTEYPGRTFALAELLVRPSWRRQGIGRTLHDLILDGRPEERATVTVPPGAAAAQAAFKRWGWRRIARTSAPEAAGAPIDVLVRGVRLTRPTGEMPSTMTIRKVNWTSRQPVPTMNLAIPGALLSAGRPTTGCPV